MRPRIPDLFLFVVGACVPFAVLNALVTGGFRERVDVEPPVVLSLGAAFGLFSASASLAVATGVAWALNGAAAWCLAALAATVAYLLLAALEIMLARRAHHAAGRTDLEQY
ncbi:MAG: hypothetical protein JO064_04880 [Actinobacteria bacterium]|nr:hypothetical protein [Actinomycetota bacterium]MBV8597672.1 hypothetical protein [Actinomycetota bacterium]